MGTDNQKLNPVDLIIPKDLDMYVSFGFIINGKQADFLSLRKIIENYADDDPDTSIVFDSASRHKLFLVTETEYEIIQQTKRR